MKTLHLTLKKKWFDMTESGEKTEEYREIKKHWVERLCHYYPGAIGGDLMDSHKVGAYVFKDFDNVIAVNGHGKHRPSWSREFEGIEVREGRPEWGAEPGKKYFVIKLGQRI